MKQKVRRVMGLSATMVGYDILIVKQFEGGKVRWAEYKNISAASMRRFYALSDSFIIAEATKEVPWHWYRKVRHGG